MGQEGGINDDDSPKAFNVETIRLGDRPDEINPRSFDVLMETLMAGAAPRRRSPR
ncbi:MAG: hypothetical protein HY985_15160 [Magnetospirillum sp.]|nr:hypothetical protein [Magnetospirillum sp.]